MQTKLTQTVVQNAKPTEKLYWMRDTLVNGFVMSVSYGGKKTYCVDFRRPNGKRATYKIGDATRYTVAEAREAAQQFLSSIEKGEDPTAQKKKLTLGEFIKNIYERWVLEYRKSGDSTVHMLESNFKTLADTPLDEITIAQVDQWRSKKKKDGLKTSSINRYITALTAAINWAVKRNLIETNPIAKLEHLAETDTVKKVRYLTKDERERLMASLDEREKDIREGRESHNIWLEERERGARPQIKDGDFADHLKPLVLLSLSTGIRRNSLLSLEWGDVNFDDKTIMVRAATAKSGEQYYVHMNKTTFDTLSRWRNQSKRTAPGSLIFPSPKTGKKMGDCRSSWENLMKMAKTENFRWHDMRHDFASQLVMRGVDLNTVRELMGHADLKMTLRYAHLAPNVKMKAVEMLDDEDS
ncbi:MAG: tyrosine-type recombinase/integrase [Synergistaceae bacterium]|jgi:integrase|nr:tyrosine-type recombinase/integrase [Synergistaceae bacterium]